MSKEISSKERLIRRVIWTVIAFGVLGLGGMGARYLLKNGPKAPKLPPEVITQSVRVTRVAVGTAEITLDSQGEVTPQRRTQLSAEVGGKLEFVDGAFEPGETFREGELLLRIDRTNYDAAHAETEALLTEAKLALEVELAKREQALRDWQKLGRGEPSDLVLRIPQLASAKARIAAAEAAVDKALRDLERIEIRAPYDCRVETTHVDVGAVITPGMALADLVSLGAVEVRLPLSLEDYGYLQRGEGQRVKGKVIATGMIGGRLKSWTGRLVRSEEIVERSTRSVNVVAEFGLDGEEGPPIGMFVKARITGEAEKDVVEVKREALVEAPLGTAVEVMSGGELVERPVQEPGRQMVLTLNAENVLGFRLVEIRRTEEKTVLVSEGLRDGDRVVITPLSAPVRGMTLKVMDDAETETAVQVETPL